MEAEFFTNNRRRITERLNGGLLCLSAYRRMQQKNDTFFPFVQESNFLYLSGLFEPDWLLIVDGHQQKTWLVQPHIDDVHLTFDGSLSAETAMATSGADAIVSAREVEALLRSLARKHSVVYTVDHPTWIDTANFVPNPAITKNRAMLERIFSSVQPCNSELAALRSIKQPQEIRAIRKAVTTTVEVFSSIHNNINDFTSEFELEAYFTGAFIKHNSQHAYEPIIAAGKNACTLHYTRNADKLKKGNLVLMDVGAEIDGYAADITRTYSWGEPTKRQAAVHAALQAAQAQIVASLAPGVSIQSYQKEVDGIMSDTLNQLGLSSNNDRNIVRQYMPHAISHGLGLDVHDSLAGATEFAEGMVLTVEPGIYIPAENIGIRIEDDILITNKGYENLSRKLPTSW